VKERRDVKKKGKRTGLKTGHYKKSKERKIGNWEIGELR
jgi:hypothetical protein